MKGIKFVYLIVVLLWCSTAPSTSFQSLSLENIGIPKLFKHSSFTVHRRLRRGNDFSHGRPCLATFSMPINEDGNIDDFASKTSGAPTLERFDASPSGKNVSDFSGWKISTKKKLPGICDLADEIGTWLLRAELGGRSDGGLDEASRAIVAEFENDPTVDSKRQRAGGATGEATSAVESWFKESRSSQDNDPSGVIKRAESNAREAQKLNMTYLDYIRIFVKKPVLPTVEILRPHARVLPADGTRQFVTTPHSYPIQTLLPRVPYSTCWYGIFFEVEAKDRDIEVTALYTQSGIYHSERRDLVNVTVYTRDGGAMGYELCQEAWTLAGRVDAARMVRVNFTSNSDPAYGRLPLDAPLRVAAGARRGFLVHTTQDRGVALRARAQGAWRAGDITDRDDHLIIRAGLLPCGDDIYSHALHGGACLSSAVFRHVFHPESGAAFVGVIDYRLL